MLRFSPQKFKIEFHYSRQDPKEEFNFTNPKFWIQLPVIAKEIKDLRERKAVQESREK